MSCCVTHRTQGVGAVKAADKFDRSLDLLDIDIGDKDAPALFSFAGPAAAHWKLLASANSQSSFDVDQALARKFAAPATQDVILAWCACCSSLSCAFACVLWLLLPHPDACLS